MKLQTYIQARSVRKKVKRVTVKRINNPAGFGQPELYETEDENGNIDREYRDQAGAEIRKRKLDRRKFKLGKGYRALKQSERIRYREATPNDSRLRRTTGGTGGTGGPGNG